MPEGDILLGKQARVRQRGYSQNHLQLRSVNPTISSLPGSSWLQPSWVRGSGMAPAFAGRSGCPWAAGAGGCRGSASGTSWALCVFWANSQGCAKCPV